MCIRDRGETLVVEQADAQLQAVPFIGLRRAMTKQAVAVLQQFDVEVVAVDLGEQLQHQWLDAKHALEKTVEDPGAVPVSYTHLLDR